MVLPPIDTAEAAVDDDDKARSVSFCVPAWVLKLPVLSEMFGPLVADDDDDENS